MKKLLKNPLKMIVAGMFVVAMGFGMFTSLKVSEARNIDLLNLNTAVAQGEGGLGEGEYCYSSNTACCLLSVRCENGNCEYGLVCFSFMQRASV